MATLIEARGLEKTYVMGEEVVRALDGATFGVDAGDYVAVIGASGSGKSTLMNVIGGLDKPSAGELVIDDADLLALDDAGLADFRNRAIGFVFQSFNLLPRMTALENVELPMVYAGLHPKDRRDRAMALLERVGLGERMSHRPTQLSGGQQQRVAIARALANEPALVLADEPTGALDTATTKDILALFRTLNAEGVTIMVVTHEMDVAESTNRIIEMRDGRIVNDRRLKPIGGGVRR
jgi:putative ABC transport system ATP-binding protein